MLSWTFVAAAAILCLLPPGIPARLRTWLLAAGSLGAVVLIWHAPLLPLLGLTLGTYGLGRLLPQLAPERRRWLQGLAIAAVVCVLLATRVQGVPVIGLSYLALKLIQHLVDAGDGRAAAVDLPSLVCTSFFFPTFAAGPIQRTTQFARELERTDRGLGDRLQGLDRIVIGIGKKFLLADPLLAYAQPLLQAPTIVAPAVLLSAVYAFAFGLYLDFAGYSDLAIGVSRAAGVVVPENFDSPYLARNIGLLWQRWHMSLTTWLRDYVFISSTRRLLRWTRNPLASQVSGQMITMVLCGLWHGLGWNFALWGAYNGAGLGALAVWRHRRGPAPSGTPVRDVLATLATFHFFAFGLILFACDLPLARQVVNRLLGLLG